MKAAVLRGARDIAVEEVPEPRLEPGGVIIKVRACGICGSDLHVYRHGSPDPMRLGHEFSGDVVEVGASVSGAAVGDRIAAMCGEGCGHCYWCRRGQWLKCSGMALLGYGVPGAFAEYVSVPRLEMGRYAAKLPGNLTYEAGATAEPLSVALYAVDRSRPRPDDTVVVIGAGVIGLCIVRVLRARGINKLLLSGRRAGRLRLARESGAGVVVDAAGEDIVARVNEETAGRGADIVYECAGSAATFRQALQMVHRGGRVELVGLYEEPITWDPSFIVSNDIDIGGTGLAFNLPGAVELMQSGRVDTLPLVTHEFPLDGIKEAFETQLTADDAVKVLVKP
jgi:(R,R)-butanediol dehydrogenase/meso-butanediol dehydrogenase/diacetyl reductase